MNWIRHHMLGSVLVAGAVILAAGGAYASSRLYTPAPTASELPVVRTSRPVVAALATSAVLPGSQGASGAASGGKASAQQPTSSKHSGSSRPAGKHSNEQKNESSDDHEVVTPPVHDSGESGD